MRDTYHAESRVIKGKGTVFRPAGAHRGSLIRYNARFVRDIAGVRGHRLSMSNQRRGRGQPQGERTRAREEVTAEG